MRGLHPPNVRFVKPYRYTVQPGDDVGVISGYFGMPVSKWPELCGANRHKKLSTDVPTGTKHRCFEDLATGEQLSVPAHWKDPVVGGLGSPLTRPSGSVGQTPVDMLVDFQTALQTVVKMIPADERPPPNMVDSLSAVIWSWWPHLQNTLPNPPPIPTNGSDIVGMISSGIFTVENWAMLFKSANAFLKATGIGQGTAPQVQNIPWSDIPWNEMAAIWDKISKSAWQALSAAMKRSSGGSHTTQPVIVSPVPVSLPPLPPSGLPNFLDPATWTSQSSSLAGVPFEKITWSETMVDALKDPRFAKCSTKDPSRVEKLAGCGQCWQDGAKQFVDLLCSDVPDPCNCDEGNEGKDPAKTDPVAATDTKKGMSTAAMVGIGLTGALLIVAVGVSMSDKGPR